MADDGLGDLSEQAWVQVTRRVQQLPLLCPYTTDTVSDEEAAATTKPCQNLLKSAKKRTADTQVIQRVDWLHELVCTTEGLPHEYEKLSIPLFVYCYVKIINGQKLPIKV